MDYINNSGYYSQAITNFEYTDLIITAILFAAGFTYLFSNKKKPGITIEIVKFRGIYHYLFTLFFIVLIMAFYLTKNDC